MKFEYAERVKDIIICILQDIPEAKKVIDNCKGKCRYILDDEAILEKIVFEFYESIVIENSKVFFLPEHGKGKVLITYESFERLVDAKPEDLKKRYQIM